MRETTVRSHRHRLAQVLAHLDKIGVEAGVESMPRLEELAEIACMSPHHFHRVFKAYTGLPVKSYVRRHRLLLAADRLTRSSQTILDIALESGFANHETFTRAFTQIFGITPAAYRMRALANGQANANDGLTPLPAPPPPQPTAGENMDLNVKTLPTMTLAKVRHTGPYNNCQIAWDKLCIWGASKGLFGPQTMFLGISWDDPESTPPEEIRYDACFTLPDGASTESDADVTITTLPSGNYATTLHKGPFSGLEAAYKQLYAAIIAREELQLRDAPAMEIYLTDPKTTPAEEYLTEICIPLEDR